MRKTDEGVYVTTRYYHRRRWPSSILNFQIPNALKFDFTQNSRRIREFIQSKREMLKKGHHHPNAIIVSYICDPVVWWIFTCNFTARLKRKTLTENDIQQIKDNTPTLKKGSSQMFRNLRDKGIISYTEYLFLLSILTSNIRIKITIEKMI